MKTFSASRIEGLPPKTRGSGRFASRELLFCQTVLYRRVERQKLQMTNDEIAINYIKP